MTISKLHYITTSPGEAELACQGGADWVQFRVKNLPYGEWKTAAMATRDICHHYGAKLIINDNVQVAKEIQADGVHLGKEDMSPEEARTILGDQFIIGGTANTFEDIERLVKAKVNYIGLGPFRFTITKKNLSPILGLEGYQHLLRRCQLARIELPIIAIGGIQFDDIDMLLSTGIHGIAVSSAISNAEDIAYTTDQFMAHLQLAK